MESFHCGYNSGCVRSLLFYHEILYLLELTTGEMHGIIDAMIDFIRDNVSCTAMGRLEGGSFTSERARLCGLDSLARNGPSKSVDAGPVSQSTFQFS